MNKIEYIRNLKQLAEALKLIHDNVLYEFDDTLSYIEQILPNTYAYQYANQAYSVIQLLLQYVKFYTCLICDSIDFDRLQYFLQNIIRPNNSLTTADISAIESFSDRCVYYANLYEDAVQNTQKYKKLLYKAEQGMSYSLRLHGLLGDSTTDYGYIYNYLNKFFPIYRDILWPTDPFEDSGTLYSIRETYSALIKQQRIGKYSDFYFIHKKFAYLCNLYKDILKFVGG